MHSVAAQVYEWWRERGDSEPERLYLGASIIGGPCERALWYGFRWSENRQFDGRLYRLFERGRNEERMVVEELRGIGCEVHDAQPDGTQFGFSDLAGHFRGHMDGAITKTPYAEKTWAVLEVKTFSAKTFKDLTDKGVEASKPEHYAQMQIYMGQTGMTRALYYAVNKDTDAIHTEWLHFDEVAYLKLMDRARRIITAAEPPIRISEDASWYQCKWCDYHSICHGAAAPRATCRTCAHSTPEMDGDGRWSCAAHKADIPADAQRVGCQQHRFIPILLERIGEYQGTPDGVNPVYTNKATGKPFANAEVFEVSSDGSDKRIPAYSSIEIRVTEDKRALGDEGVQAIRAEFGARIGVAA